MKLGIQLYSVRNSFQQNPNQTLQKLSEAGYRYLEAANHHADTDDGVGFGIPASELKTTLDTYGLSIVGCHINPLRLDRLDAILDYQQELGCNQIGCDMEMFPYGDLDYVKQRCEHFNQVGKKCADRGMKYYYHNHYEEFQCFTSDGITIYDFIMANTDPELVFIEMDTYWMARGGVDPVDYIRKYKNRLLMLHQKDFPANAPQPLNMYDGIINPDANITMDVFDATINPLCFTEIGHGILPIQSYIDAAEGASNLEYIILEQDHSTHDELKSVKISMQGFQQFKGVQLH